MEQRDWDMGRGAYKAPKDICGKFAAAWAKKGVALAVRPYAGAFGCFEAAGGQLAANDDGAAWIAAGDFWLEFV